MVAEMMRILNSLFIFSTAGMRRDAQFNALFGKEDGNSITSVQS